MGKRLTYKWQALPWRRIWLRLIYRPWIIKSWLRYHLTGDCGNAGGRYPHRLHFDCARLDARMARYSLDWPSSRLAARAAENAVKQDCFDPAVFLKERV